MLRIRGDFADLDARRQLEDLDGARLLRADDSTAILSIENDGGGLMDVLPRVLSLGVEDVAIQRPNLEGVFIALTGRELRD